MRIAECIGLWIATSFGLAMLVGKRLKRLTAKTEPKRKRPLDRSDVLGVGPTEIPAPETPAKQSATHPSHVARFSDASTFNEICDACGCTDATPEGTYALTQPCSQAKTKGE
jgi:hypothetical protein